MSKTRNNFNQNDVLKKIRSVYITKKILDNLNQIKLMNIIHYNKKYQKLMKISLKDFKNEFSKIEIEIIPEENTFGKFVNITKKICEENNVRIYFNDKKEEINRNYIAKDDNVKKIKIIINHKIKSLYRFFEDCKCIKKINFIKFNKDDIKNMSYMFYRCSSLEELNLSNFNTNNVIDMSWMFSYCSSLKELNLSNFNTNNVINMSHMFY
jgi:surface protein